TGPRLDADPRPARARPAQFPSDVEGSRPTPMNDADLSVLDRVRRALGRTHPLTTPPEPPALDEPTVRLVHTDLGLGDLFARRAAEMNIGVTQCYVEELADRIVAFLQSQNVRRLMLS